MTAHKHVWVTCAIESIKKTISYYDFNKVCSMALLDLEGKHHNIKSFGTLKNEKDVVTIQNYGDKNICSYVQTSTKCIRLTNKTMDPDTSFT